MGKQKTRTNRECRKGIQSADREAHRHSGTPQRQTRSTGHPSLTVSDERLHRLAGPPSADQKPSSNLDPPTDERQPALEPLLTIAEVARHYRISERTVRRRIKDGTIRKALSQGRLVRISGEELRRLSGVSIMSDKE